MCIRDRLCAAWSDTKGVESFVKTWYVGNSRTRFEQVCNDIWKITLQLASKNFGNVCLVLTRLDSVLPDDELIHWRRLSVATKDLHLAVVCVGDNTKLTLFDEDKTYPTFKNLFRTKSNPQTGISNSIDDLETVSYTHLDVYKRQVVASVKTNGSLTMVTTVNWAIRSIFQA